MKIVIVTSAFPFPPGEQFLEAEIKFWGNTKFNEVILLPGSSVGEPRLVPEGIRISTKLAEDTKKYIYVIKALLSPILFKEFRYLAKAKKITPRNLFAAIKSTAQLLKAKTNLFKFLEVSGPVDLVYTYWNSNYTYAACYAKNKYYVKKVVSRIHRFDLYEERRAGNYMPLKRQFSSDIDKLFVLSEEAKNYCAKAYGFERNKIDISPLGVKLPVPFPPSPVDGSFSIVSVSFCVPVKRIDKIIKSIAAIAIESPDIEFKWNHIGDGPLKQDLMNFATEQLRGLKNVRWEFLGHLKNQEVLNFLSANRIDCFVNASESEGIPVSIMEAMAVGVPAIAPNVGGIADLVTDDCGVLLSAEANVEEIVAGLKKIKQHPNPVEFKKRARQRVCERFNAELNYPKFIRILENLSLSSKK